MEDTDINLEYNENSAVGDSEKGFCSEAPQIAAAGQNPVEQEAGETPLTGEEHSSPCSLSSENLEGLSEKVVTLGLQVTRKNCCGAAKKRARKAKLAEAYNGDSSSGQNWSALGSKPHTLQRRPNELWCVPFLLFRPTCSTALLLLEFLLEQ
jgi:hypothetical protein